MGQRVNGLKITYLPAGRERGNITNSARKSTGGNGQGCGNFEKEAVGTAGTKIQGIPGMYDVDGMGWVWSSFTYLKAFGGHCSCLMFVFWGALTSSGIRLLSASGKEVLQTWKAKKLTEKLGGTQTL